MNITSRFKEIVSEYGDRIALASEYEGELTYKQLNHYANFVAEAIISNAGNANPIIGICIQRSFKMIAVMLGVLKAGLAYVPIDPAYPIERVSYCLEKSGVVFVLCDEASQGVISDCYEKIFIPEFSDIKEREFSEYVSKGSEALAYIQYTSGSTGNPRGVMISHNSIMNTLKWQIDYYHMCESDVTLQIPSYAFASSVENIYATLLSGGRLILIKAKDLLKLSYLKHLINKYEVTNFIMVPSLYREFVSYLKGNSSLRYVTIAGEPFDQSIVNKHYEILPNAVLYNEYGMTETSVACFATEVNKECVPNTIGRVINNMQAIIVDPDEDGIGELYVTGVGLARGYHNEDDANCEKFVEINKMRYFKTGDFVREDSEGRFIHMGRRDKQIKVSGQRVNLSEIDNVLNALETVSCAVSTIVKIKDTDKILTFVETASEDMDSLKEVLANKLPSYYMPNYIKKVDEFEYLPNRKINIRKMGEDFMENYNEEVLRNNEIVKKLIELIKECSDDILNTVDLNKDVRTQGISSIQYIQFIAMVEESFGFEFGYDDLDQISPVSVKALFEYISAIEG